MAEEKKEEQGGAKEEDNLWVSFLSNAGKQGKVQEGHLIVLGSPGSGKTAVVSQFSKLETSTGEMKKFLLMRYSYIHVTDPDSDRTHGLLNVWQVSEPEHAKVLDSVIPVEHTAHLAWMICLDLSSPSTVKQEFDKWMVVLEETQKRLLERASAKLQGELTDKLYSIVQFYVNPNDAEAQEQTLTAEEKEELELQRERPEVNLAAPIIVVGTKADAFKKHFAAEADANDHYDIMISYIRTWALKYGAACFSMAKGLKEQARRILQYVDHRVFDARFSRAPSVVVSLSNLTEEFLFVPTGFDSQSIIQTQAGGRSMDTPFEHYFPEKKETSRKGRRGGGEAKLKATADNTFLKTLGFDLAAAEKEGPSSGSRGGRSGARPVGGGGEKATKGSSKEKNAAVQKFFNQLLHSGASTGGRAAGGKKDAAEALRAVKEAAASKDGAA